MKKIFLLLLTLIIVLGCFALIYINYKGIDFISSYLSKTLNTEVKIEHASVGFQNIKLDGIKILNPEGALRYAFTAESVDIDFSFISLFKNTVIIPRIAIEDPTFGIEFYNLDGSDNNWKRLLTHVGDEPLQGSQVPASKEDKKFIIDQLIIEDLHIEAQHKLLGPYSINIPLKQEIVFHHLTSDQAVRFKSALILIFKSISEIVSRLKGFKAFGSEPISLEDISDAILTNIHKQTPQQIDAASEEDSKWEKVTKEIETGTKKAQDFFHRIFH